VVLPVDAPVWDPRVFTKKRERLLKGDSGAGLLCPGA